MSQTSLSIAATITLLIGTIGGGLFHGQMTNRWEQHADSRLAEQHLREKLPNQVGNWRLRKETELEASVVSLLQCPAYISRVYEHEQTGDVLSVAVLLGPPGPISVHTPEICYSSHDFSIVRAHRPVALADGASNNHTFWEVNLKSNRPEGANLQVLYAWGLGETWNAAEYPRFGYGGVTHLYKIQLASVIESQHEDFDPSRDFLKVFLPQLQPKLVLASH